MVRPVYIVRLALVVLLPLLLALAPAKAQIVVHQGQTTTLSVVQVPGDTYSWELYSDGTVNFATVPGNCPPAFANFVGGSTGKSVNVQWSQLGTYFFKVTARDAIGCTNNLKIGMVKVILPQFSAVAGNDTVVGICSSYVLDASKSFGDGLTYRWDLLDPGGTLSPNNSVKAYLSLSSGYTGALPISFRIALTVTNIFGVSAKDTVKVTFGPSPKVGIIYPDSPNKDGSMMIDGKTSTGQGLKYQWASTKGEIIGAADKPQVLIKGAGFYSLEVTDVFGCISAKMFQYPFEPNDLIANADYVRTSWVDSIHIHVLNNDYDSRNDINKRTLSIVKKPNFGSTQINRDGTIVYSPNTRKALVDQFIYQICDSVGLCDTARVTIDIFDGPVWIPEAISPNGDGHNEYFVIRGLEDYKNSSLMIYTRSGLLIYKSMDYMNDWSGHALNSALPDGSLLPTGTYYYVLHLGGTNRYLKGFVYLLY